jgi:hypothetical protein
MQLSPMQRTLLASGLLICLLHKMNMKFKVDENLPIEMETLPRVPEWHPQSMTSCEVEI